jgi:hypothetical protein
MTTKRATAADLERGLVARAKLDQVRVSVTFHGEWPRWQWVVEIGSVSVRSTVKVRALRVAAVEYDMRKEQP